MSGAIPLLPHTHDVERQNFTYLYSGKNYIYIYIYIYIYKEPVYRPDRSLGLQEIEVLKISRQSEHEDVKFVSPTHQPPLPPPPGDILSTHFC